MEKANKGQASDNTDPTPEQLLYLVTLFKNRVLQSSGQRFQDLFVEVMEKATPGFRSIKPQGSKGDQGNDGYVSSSGTYYQVYAPEEPDTKVPTAVKKAKVDFEKIKKNWGNLVPVREYVFVQNDKFRGIHPDVEQAVTKVGRDHALDKSSTFSAAHLVNQFTSLPPAQQSELLGSVIPRSEYIDDIQLPFLTSVLQHIADTYEPLTQTQLLIVPDFGAKIQFNDLSDTGGALLRNGSFQHGAIENYFRHDGDLTRQQTQTQLSTLYVQCNETLADVGVVSRGDHLLIDMLDKLGGNTSRPAQDAAIALIAFFFESCDVFEDPST